MTGVDFSRIGEGKRLGLKTGNTFGKKLGLKLRIPMP
jgi:hypothetical protein